MHTLKAWIYFWGVFAGYLLYKLRLRQTWPMWYHRSQLSQQVWGTFIRWNPRIRVVHPERCPQHHPAIFAANHVKLDDPFWTWRAVHRSTQERLFVRFMARDDYFTGPPWDYLPININDFLVMGGTVLISRDGISLSQIKPLMKILEEPGSFVLFPGRTRSRSGMLFEYREGIDEPGSASFFMTHVQRRHPELRIAAAPVCRTHHPVSRVSAMVFGEPFYLDAKADRAAQRALDFALTEAIGALVEVNAAHIIAGILYLRALHSMPLDLPIDALTTQLTQVRDALPGTIYLHPALSNNLINDVRSILKFFARKKFVQLHRNTITIHPPKILSTPPLENNYRHLNPIKFQINQILHLRPVTDALEAAVLQ